MTLQWVFCVELNMEQRVIMYFSNDFAGELISKKNFISCNYVLNDCLDYV